MISLPRAAIMGATGYAGAELVRLLLNHPGVQLASVVSRSSAGRRLDAVHPGVAGLTDLVFAAPDAEELASHDVVFLAVPHGSAAEWAKQLHALDCERIIDLSSDHRHAAGWVYGQAEWNTAEIEDAQRISIPGCFATAISLALAPFVATGTIEGAVQCVAATGSTGSGATPSPGTHHPERFVNLKAYKVLSHQHTPEVEAFLGGLGDFDRLHFVPLSAPIDRGILATTFFRFKEGTGSPASILEAAYSGHPLVRVRIQSPELRHVRGSGFCDLFVEQEGDQVVVLSALDNLGKGAAGQAIQCLNLSYGFPVNTGLEFAPCLP